jgi:2-polyprenyl-6-methoxyphenol hydroxylase-like FAD-dependent oxidoreductase
VAADSILIAGAGIGGLTTALALARRGFRVRLFDQMERLEEVGAGIQLAPNATRILIALGLADRLKTRIVEPAAIRLRSGPSGGELAVLPLQAPPADAGMTERYGAPYWVIHRADLHKSLTEAVAAEPGISLTLGAPVNDFSTVGAGVRAAVHPRNREWTGEGYDGTILIGADGLWSRLRVLLGDRAAPRFAGRSAFRAVVAAHELPAHHREPVVSLWLGPGGHVVHYPVRVGEAVNIVAVCSDRWQSVAWSTGAGRNAVLDRFPASAWSPAVRELLAAPEHWHKWALYDRPPLKEWGRGPVTLLGDAAHPMLPFLAQGASMAIEDAAVLTRELVHTPDDGQGALRRYEAARRPRTARVQHAARHSDFSYHLRWPAAPARDAALRALGGQRLLAQYDWIYRWRP